MLNLRVNISPNVADVKQNSAGRIPIKNKKPHIFSYFAKGKDPHICRANHGQGKGDKTEDIMLYNSEVLQLNTW